MKWKYVGASITASIRKIISKKMSKNEENLQKSFWSVCKFWSVNYKSYSVKSIIYYLYQSRWYKTQNQSPRGVPLKRCSATPQQIYSRAPMQKCCANFFEITFLYGCPPVNLLHICKTHFWREARRDSFWK